MNKAFDDLCDKHELAEETRDEFKKMFEEEIIRVFYRMSVEATSEKMTKISKTGAAKKDSKSKTSDLDVCQGRKANGDPCTFKAKENGYCGRHDPDKVSSSKKTSKLKTKKSINVCHGLNPKTKKACISPGTVKPPNANFHYCTRHAEKWTDFESDHEEELKGSEPEEAEEEETEE